MALPLAALGIGANLLGSAYGLFQGARANALERNNQLPVAQVNSLLAQNAAQARNMAQIGLSNTQYNNALQQNQNNLSTILASASRSGRNIPVAGLLRQANQATTNLNIQDEQARRQNQILSMQQNQTLAQEQQRVWNWNKAQPYLRTAQQVASMRNAGVQNIFNGIGGATAIAMGGGLGGQQQSTQGQAGLQYNPFAPINGRQQGLYA
jgi:hypothetical protein